MKFKYELFSSRPEHWTPDTSKLDSGLVAVVTATSSPSGRELKPEVFGVEVC